MSTLTSKHSSKANITISLNNNEPQSSNRNKIKNQKTTSKYSSSALSNRQQQMQITFQKTGQKVKKNLSKQFQTFNINQEKKNKNQEQIQASKTNSKNNNSQNMTKSKTNAQMTTQAKSPLVKSNLSSKMKSSQNKQKQKVQQTKSRKQSQELKKSRQKSNRSKSPMSQNRSQSGSRKSSPQLSPSYSKKSISSFQRALSRKKLQKSNNTQFQKNQKHEKTQNPSFLKQKNTSQRKMKSQRNDFQINFPHLITQSQSVYPSSSYPNTGPNTGKLSQNYQRFHSGQEQSNIHIQQEQQRNSFEENQPTQEDYISENLSQQQDNLGMSQTYLSKQIQNDDFYKQKFTTNTKGYQQLPLSYITAMQILQKKIEQHETTIKKLLKTIKSKDLKYLQLENHLREIQNELDIKQSVIVEKQNEIKFLKGYLNEEKINNREALKQIAKNVYERSISAKKEKKSVKKNYTDDIDQQTKGQQRRKLFQGSPEKQQTLTKGIKQTQPDFIQKLIAPQIHQMQLMEKSREKQRLLQQELEKQELIKDEMMREQILRQQALREQIKINSKKYNYMEEDNYGRGHQRDRQYQQIGAENGFVSKEMGQNYSQLGSLNRQRSVSTVIKRLQERQPDHLTYRPRNVSVRNHPQVNYENERNYSLKKQSPYLNDVTPIKRQQLKDPILEKYIQQKSSATQNPYMKGRTTQPKNRQTLISDSNFYRGFQQLKSEKKNRDAVSQMRQLMRAEKQLIVLNYKLQAIEKKILLSVQSVSNEPNQNKKYQNSQQNPKLVLEQLQKQYSIMKKQYQKKEILVRQLKMKLQPER